MAGIMCGLIKIVILLEMSAFITIALVIAIFYCVIGNRVNKFDNSEHKVYCNICNKPCIKPVLFTPYNNCSACEVYEEYVNMIERGD